MFTREFVLAGTDKRVTVVLNPAGWELRQESDQGVVMRTLYRDWHRVERALQLLGVNEVPGVAESSRQV